MHICGKRYVDREEPVTRVTVYSNQPRVELLASGKSLGKQESDVHFFYFDVPNEGETALVAIAGDCRDESRIRRVKAFNPAYRLRERGAVLNWFDITHADGCYSLEDKAEDVLRSPEARKVLLEVLSIIGGEKAAEMDDGMIAMMGSMTVLRAINLMGAVGKRPDKETLLELNRRLNGIKKV